MNIVYFLQRENGDIKIGTTGDFFIRFQHLVKSHGCLTIIGAIEGDKQKELATQGIFSDYRIGNSDWFKPSVGLIRFAGINTSIDLRPYQARLDEALCIKTGHGRITPQQEQLIAQARRKKRQLPLSHDMTEALAKEAEKQGRDEASIIRDALNDYLRKRGHKLTMKVEHGGRRPYGDKEPQL